MGNNCFYHDKAESDLIIEKNEESHFLKSSSIYQTQLKESRLTSFNKRVLDTMKEKYAHDNQNQMTVTPITISEFNEKLQSIPRVEQLLYENNFEFDIENDNSNLYQMMPIILENMNNSEGKEYFYGSVNSKGELTGFGTLITKDDSVYRGNFTNDLFNGKGIFISSKGDYYVGDWKEGESEGKGYTVYKNMIKYEGDYKSNMKNGKGKETYSDGSEYIGDFINNEKDGNGKLIYPNGAYYQGSFKRDQFNGKGEYYWSDGRKYQGDFENSQMHGFGIHTWSDGEKYEGNYQYGKKQGKGTYYWNDGKKYVGYWMNNEPNGTGYFDIGGSKYDVTFRAGKIVLMKNEDDSCLGYETPPEIGDPQFNK